MDQQYKDNVRKLVTNSYRERRKIDRRAEDSAGHHVHIHCDTYIKIEGVYGFDRLFMGPDRAPQHSANSNNRDDNQDPNGDGSMPPSQ